MKHITLIVVLLSGILFTILFHRQPPGLNLVIFEFLLFGFLFFRKEINLKNRTVKFLFVLQVISCFNTILMHSVFSYFSHLLILITFTGVILYPSTKSVVSSLIIAFQHTVKAQWEFIKQLIAVKILDKSPGLYLWNARILVIPLAILIMFISIYNYSNPVFNNLSANIFSGFTKYIILFFETVDLSLFFTLVLGIIVSNFLLQRVMYPIDIRNDLKASNLLQFRSLGSINKAVISNELKSAIFLLLALNVTILILNVIEIKYVWFGFAWEGQYLKQFVHSGTNLLILSILISIAIVLYFFRGGINYIKSPVLKYLSYAWLFQNCILAFSVFLRNYYYIQHFNLAYKRIGVILFLALTIYGLFTVFMKVKNRYSTYYLFRKNFSALLIVFIIGTFLIWDPFIAGYNFANRDRAFVHFNYLVGLSDKALPQLDVQLEELMLIHENQTKKFPQESNYLSPEKFYELIQRRKLKFKTRWEDKGWLSWNFPDYLAYQKLFHPAKVMADKSIGMK